jgi:hypothetical protein
VRVRDKKGEKKIREERWRSGVDFVFIFSLQ